MSSKKVKGVLVVNYKTGDVKVYKRNPDCSAAEIPIKFEIELSLEEPKTHQFVGKIVVPTVKVADMVMENL